MTLRRERSLEIVRELRLTSMALKNVSQARLIHPLAEAQRGCEMLRGRPMRTQLCGAVAGDRRQLEHSGCVRRTRGMPGQSIDVRGASPAQSRQRARVELGAPLRGEGLLDGVLRELVAKAHSGEIDLEDAASDALVEGGRVLVRDFEKNIFLARTFDDGRGIHHVPRRTRQS